MKKSGTIVSDLLLYMLPKRLEKYDEIWYNQYIDGLKIVEQ